MASNGLTKVTAEQITDLASRAGLKLQDGHAKDYCALTNWFEGLVAALPDDQDLLPRPDLTLYPRVDVHVPEDTEGGGWATKVSELVMLLPTASGN